jgi:putative membrane protein
MAGDLPHPAPHTPPGEPGPIPAGTPPDPPRRHPGAAATGESEPDARFTFANERTFLAWHRTALALVVAGLAIIQLLPPFPGIPVGRHLLAVPLIVLGGTLSVGSYLEWARHQRAMRRGEPLGNSVLPRVLAIAITVLSLAAAVLSLLAPGSGN